MERIVDTILFVSGFVNLGLAATHNNTAQALLGVIFLVGACHPWK